MLCHVTLLKWADRPLVDEEQLGRDMAALKGKLPYLLAVQAGPDLGFGEDDYDFALVAHFADESGWRQYQADPEHLKIAHVIAPNLASRVTVQFNVPD